MKSEQLELLRRLGKVEGKAKLGRVLGVSRSTVYNILSGRTDISIGQMYSLCEHFGCTVNEFLNGKISIIRII